MINKTLDLPFDEPQETYSTSEHLFHDQGIPPGTKGRIVDPAPVGARAPRSKPARPAPRAPATAAAPAPAAASRSASGPRRRRAASRGFGLRRALGRQRQPQPPAASSFRRGLHERHAAGLIPTA